MDNKYDYGCWNRLARIGVNVCSVARAWTAGEGGKMGKICVLAEIDIVHHCSLVGVADVQASGIRGGVCGTYSFMLRCIIKLM